MGLVGWLMPTCGFCGAVFAKPTDMDGHGLGGHPWVPGGADVIYFEGDFPDVAVLCHRPPRGWRRVLFTVRRPYFDAIVAGTKTSELRRASRRWRTVADRRPGIAVFLCGRSVHRRAIAGVRILPDARTALGREPSPQGAADLGDGQVIAFDLGPPIP